MGILPRLLRRALGCYVYIGLWEGTVLCRESNVVHEEMENRRLSKQVSPAFLEGLLGWPEAFRCGRRVTCSQNPCGLFEVGQRIGLQNMNNASLIEALEKAANESTILAHSTLLQLAAERLTELHNAIESTLDSCVYEDQLPVLKEISEKHQ